MGENVGDGEGVRPLVTGIIPWPEGTWDVCATLLGSQAPNNSNVMVNKK